MSRRHVLDGLFDYTIADDDPPPLDLLPRAVLRARVLDELTLQPPLAPITLTSSLVAPGADPTAPPRGVVARVADGGYCGVVARPRDAAYALVTHGAFRARVTAPGYLPRDLTPAIDAARRALALPAPNGAQTLRVNPPEPAARPQFRVGRGVMIERPAPLAPDDFTTVDARAVPPNPPDVPIVDPVGLPRLPGTHVAGVPITLPDQLVHRDAALRLRGRVQVRVNPTTLAPGAGAQIGIRGIWLDYPSSTTTAPQPPDLCAIRPTARVPHAPGAAIGTYDLNPGGPIRRLRAFAPAESRDILLQPTAGLNPAGGDTLVVDDPLIGEYETVVTAGFDPSVDPNLAAVVRLRTPLGCLHRPGAPVQGAAPAPTAIPNASAVARETLVGDAVLFGAGLPAFPQPSTIGVEVGTPRAAFYRATLFPTVDGANVFTNQIVVDPLTGRFDWPPIARIAQLRIIVVLGAFNQQRDVALDYNGDIPIAIVLT